MPGCRQKIIPTPLFVRARRVRFHLALVSPPPLFVGCALGEREFRDSRNGERRLGSARMIRLSLEAVPTWSFIAIQGGIRTRAMAGCGLRISASPEVAGGGNNFQRV